MSCLRNWVVWSLYDGSGYAVKDWADAGYNPGWAKTGGRTKRTKMIRSLTPRGFARAVFLANDRAITRTTLNRVLPD